MEFSRNSIKKKKYIKQINNKTFCIQKTTENGASRAETCLARILQINPNLDCVPTITVLKFHKDWSTRTETILSTD